MNDLPLSETSLPEGLIAEARFRSLAAVTVEVEWFANIDNPHAHRAHQGDIQDFTTFLEIQQLDQFRQITREHVIDWRKRKQFEEKTLTPATIWSKLAPLFSLFEHLCECNAGETNPVVGTKRPKVDSQEHKTPALGDNQALALLLDPDQTTLKSRRDRALLSILLLHGQRREELCLWKIKDVYNRRGIQHLRIHGKEIKLRDALSHPGTTEMSEDYLEAGRHRAQSDAVLFQRMRGAHRVPRQTMTAARVYKPVQVHGITTKIDLQGLNPHAS